MNMKKDY